MYILSKIEKLGDALIQVFLDLVKLLTLPTRLDNNPELRPHFSGGTLKPSVNVIIPSRFASPPPPEQKYEFWLDIELKHGGGGSAMSNAYSKALGEIFSKGVLPALTFVTHTGKVVRFKKSRHCRYAIR